MARGDLKWFNSALLALGSKKIDLTSDTLKVGIVTGAVALTVNTPDPRWGAGGGTDLSANQVPLGAAYTGPVALSGVTWALVSNVPTLRAGVVTIPQDGVNGVGAGFSTGHYAVIYDDTATGKPALGFVDLGGPLGNVTGPLTLDWNGANNDLFLLPA